MTVLFTNGALFDGHRYVGAGEVVIEAGRVVEVRSGGFEAQASGRLRTSTTEVAEVVDLRGGLLAPGFVDAHTHLDACGARDPEVLAQVLDRATSAGVTAMVTTADDLASARWAAWAAGATWTRAPSPRATRPQARTARSARQARA